MKLWIRNQTRTEIMECNHLSVKETIVPNKKKSEWSIVANFGWVGAYESMERCLEIIDEIQEILMHNEMILFKNVDISQIPKVSLEPFKALAYLPNGDNQSSVSVHNAECVVYEMPEK